MDAHDPGDARLRSGVPGLDDVLQGGLPAHRVYLLAGDPGAGKTTFGLQFLLEGAKNQERCFYAALSESKRELEAVARSHGWSLDGIVLHEMSGTERPKRVGVQQTVFHTAEVELKEALTSLLDEVDRHAPSRIVLDSLAEIRLLAQNPARYRREILALKQYFTDKEMTVILLDDRTKAALEGTVETVVHGIIELEQLTPEYGTSGRRLSVKKLRGVEYRAGFHDFTIARGGLIVHPRLSVPPPAKVLEGHPVESGVPELDALLGGGIDRGTSLLLVGGAGTGKSALVTQFIRKALAAGEKAAMYLFDERVSTLLLRSRRLNIDMDTPIKSGNLELQQIDPAELSPGEFTTRVRRAVERDGVRMVAIDTLNGYLRAMPEERYVITHLHELLAYLGESQVTSLLTLAQHGMLGGELSSPLDLSYLADSVLLLRYFESQGKVRKAISAVKKRTGPHEDAIRELQIGPKGILVGKPLVNFHGVLTGVPTFHGTSKDLIEGPDRRHDSGRS